MRGVLFGLAALGVGGAAMTRGLGGGADYEREIAKSPTAVYAAFSTMAEAGEFTEAGADATATITSRVKKVSGKSMVIEALVGKASAVRMEFDFSSAKGGSATYVTAEVDVDKAAMARLYPELGSKLNHMPDAFIDAAFARWMEKNVQRVEAGETLESFDLTGSSFESAMASRDPAEAVEMRRWRAEEEQRKAAAPVATAEPMVDPNRSARDYLNGN